VIGEREIDAVFDDRTIRLLLAGLKLSSSVEPGNDIERQHRLKRFTYNVRTAVRCYFAVHAHTKYLVIREEVEKLYRLAVKAKDGKKQKTAA